MPSTGPAEDRLAIRELLETYADAVCRRDADDWGATPAIPATTARSMEPPVRSSWRRSNC
jgi:hypothetical protein